jgi:predicted short-subunit dehydrogenase-like oxidoreductase (DUF2520 family)
VGTGQLAQALGPAIAAKGLTVKQVYGRDQKKAQALAGLCGAAPVSAWSEIDPSADFYLLCVPESVVTACAALLVLKPSAWVLHCAGMAPLIETRAKSGVLWPVQMFGSSPAPWGNPLLVVEAANPADLPELMAFAACLSTTVQTLEYKKRQELHLMATWVSNFSNHLYHLADLYLQEKGLDLSLLQGIIFQTALSLEKLSPAAAQAGPAWRKSETALALHRKLLANHPSLLDWYNQFSQSIMDAKEKG